MERRTFLVNAAVCGATLALGTSGCASRLARTQASSEALSGVRIIDAHAHPDMDYLGTHWKDTSASYRYMQEANMAASFFAAVGDKLSRNPSAGSSAFDVTKRQLDWWLNGIVKDRKVTLVLKSADIPLASGDNAAPGAILAIEGGDAFEGSLDKIEAFHALGVRMTTLVHFHNNEIGDVMKPWPGKDPGPYRGGLSGFGRKAVEKMESMGMVVDVAHASPATFQDILSVATKPVIDSHTNVCSKEQGCGRMRTWKEMELVAGNGGVTCTWPMAYKTLPRKTVADWAREIVEMKRNLGMEHVGLGTDGGGYLRHKVAGYTDERDIGNLAGAMLEAGLSKDDVAAYMGGNVLRVLTACIG